MTIIDRAASRRDFVRGGVAAAGGLLLAHSSLSAATSAPRALHPDDRWLDQMRGQERHLFDSSSPMDGRMLALMRHYHDIYRDVFGQGDGAISTVGTFYGGITFYGLDDSMWRKYRLAESGGQPATAPGNPWRSAPLIGGSPAPTASIETLQGRGAVFILCRAALGTRVTQLAERDGLPRDQVMADMESHLLPGVVLVASVIVAIQRAQRSGVSYYRIG